MNDPKKIEDCFKSEFGWLNKFLDNSKQLNMSQLISTEFIKMFVKALLSMLEET